MVLTGGIQNSKTRISIIRYNFIQFLPVLAFMYNNLAFSTSDHSESLIS